MIRSSNPLCRETRSGRLIVMGKGWGRDRKYQPRNAPDIMRGERLPRVEVPSVLDAAHYLDILGEKSGDE